MIKQLLLTAVVFCVAFASTAQQSASAVEYMNQMSASTSQITSDVWDYTRTVSHGKSARKVEKRREELKNTLLQSKKSVSKMVGYNGNTEYKTAVLDFLTMYYDVLNEDYAKIVDMEAIAEDSYDNMEAYMTAQQQASDRLEEAGNALNTAEEKFAKDNEVTLLESSSKRNEKIKIASEVHESYNQVYLIFFKSYKQEMYLIESMGNGDVNGMEQNRSALIATVNEGMEKLKSVTKYQNDLSMITATKDLFAFYRSEAENSVAKVTDYYLKKEAFDKVNATFNAIKEAKRTQADIDKFNKAVGDYNAAVNEYNTLNTKLNNERNQLIDEWNKSAAKFLDKHVPRGK